MSRAKVAFLRQVSGCHSRLVVTAISLVLLAGCTTLSDEEIALNRLYDEWGAGHAEVYRDIGNREVDLSAGEARAAACSALLQLGFPTPRRNEDGRILANRPIREDDISQNARHIEEARIAEVFDQELGSGSLPARLEYKGYSLEASINVLVRGAEQSFVEARLGSYWTKPPTTPVLPVINPTSLREGLVKFWQLFDAAGDQPVDPACTSIA